MKIEIPRWLTCRKSSDGAYACIVIELEWTNLEGLRCRTRSIPLFSSRVIAEKFIRDHLPDHAVLCVGNDALPLIMESVGDVRSFVIDLPTPPLRFLPFELVDDVITERMLDSETDIADPIEIECTLEEQHH